MSKIVISWTDKAGKEHSIEFRDRQAARQFIAKLERSRDFIEYYMEG